MRCLSLAESHGGFEVGTDIHTIKAFLYALVLTLLELRKLYGLSRTKQQERSIGCIVYLSFWLKSAFRWSSAKGWLIYMYQREAFRCSFRQSGQCEGLNSVERVTELAPRFLFYVSQTFSITPVKVACRTLADWENIRHKDNNYGNSGFFKGVMSFTTGDAGKTTMKKVDVKVTDIYGSHSSKKK